VKTDDAYCERTVLIFFRASSCRRAHVQALNEAAGRKARGVGVFRRLKRHG
jgi:hypothetical protein